MVKRKRNHRMIQLLVCSSVYIFSMSYGNDKDSKLTLVYFVNNPIRPDTDTPCNNAPFYDGNKFLHLQRIN
jgi:hypothetical protein